MKSYLIVLLGLISFPSKCLAQKSDSEKVEIVCVFLGVEKELEYPGGIEKLKKLVQENLTVPKSLVGKKVPIEFKILKNGSTSEIKIAESSQKLRKREIRKLIQQMNKWSPPI